MKPDATVDIPDCAEHVWICFNDLHNARGAGFNGPNPISFPDIAAWCVLNGTRLKAWELLAIRALDRRLIDGPEKPKSGSNLFDDLKRMAAKNKRNRGRA